MKYLIVGLGNIGKKYENTRHNIGFKIVDYLVSLLGGNFKKNQFGLIEKCNYKNNELIILKPNTYMNFSGISVRFWLNYEHISISNLIVLVDDLYLNLGIIRIKSFGSSGGHNGLKSIENELCSKNYIRLRFGIGTEFKKGEQIHHVLGNWNQEEKDVIADKIILSINALKFLILNGVTKTMNVFNNN